MCISLTLRYKFDKVIRVPTRDFCSPLVLFPQVFNGLPSVPFFRPTKFFFPLREALDTFAIVVVCRDDDIGNDTIVDDDDDENDSDEDEYEAKVLSFDSVTIKRTNVSKC